MAMVMADIIYALHMNIGAIFSLTHIVANDIWIIYKKIIARASAPSLLGP